MAPAPAGVDSVAASTLPLNALTAVQALDLLGLAAGQTILVTGAAGGLGGFGVELAAMRGLRVVAAAGDDDEKLVRELGAATSSRARPTWRPPSGTWFPAGWTRYSTPPCWATRPWTRCAAEDRSPRSCSGPVRLRGIRVVPVNIRADGAALTGLAALAASGKLTLRVAGTYPLADAARAHERLEAAGVRGRLVLVP